MQTPKLFQALFRRNHAKRSRFPVKGMHCVTCADRVEKAVRQLPGISSIRVDFVVGDVFVEYEPEKVTPEQIQQQIVAAGYVATAAQ